MHTHTTASVYTPWRRASRTAGEEAHFPSPFTSSRVVGVLVGYSPEFTVKRKQWPRQNRSLGTNARKIGEKQVDAACDRSGSSRSATIDSSDCHRDWSSRRFLDRWLTNERTKFNQDKDSTIIVFRILIRSNEKVFERNRDRRVEKKSRNCEQMDNELVLHLRVQ